jgi:hypothetical protein
VSSLDTLHEPSYTVTTTPRDLGDSQDDHAEKCKKDAEESQRGSAQDGPPCRCPLEEALLGRLLWSFSVGTLVFTAEGSRSNVRTPFHHLTKSSCLRTERGRMWGGTEGLLEGS